MTAGWGRIFRTSGPHLAIGHGVGGAWDGGGYFGGGRMGKTVGGAREGE